MSSQLLLDSAAICERASTYVDRRGLARGRYTDAEGRHSVEGALQAALASCGGSLRSHPRVYAHALGAVEHVIGDADLADRSAPGRQRISSWSDHEATTPEEASAVLLGAATHLRSIEWS